MASFVSPLSPLVGFLLYCDYVFCVTLSSLLYLMPFNCGMSWTILLACILPHVTDISGFSKNLTSRHFLSCVFCVCSPHATVRLRYWVVAEINLEQHGVLDH